MASERSTLVEEIEATIRGAAGGNRVLVVRLMVGKDVSVPKLEIAKLLHERFPGSSIEIKDGDASDAVVVKDIEVE